MTITAQTLKQIRTSTNKVLLEKILSVYVPKLYKELDEADKEFNKRKLEEPNTIWEIDESYLIPRMNVDIIKETAELRLKELNQNE